jgi:hypothetical protein
MLENSGVHLVWPRITDKIPSYMNCQMLLAPSPGTFQAACETELSPISKKGLVRDHSRV